MFICAKSPNNLKAKQLRLKFVGIVFKIQLPATLISLSSFLVYSQHTLNQFFLTNFSWTVGPQMLPWI